MIFRYLMILALTLLPAGLSAGYKNTELLYRSDLTSIDNLRGWGKEAEKHWRPKGGVPGCGAFYFQTKTINDTDWMSLPLDPKRFQGLIQVEVMIKGKNLNANSQQVYYGPKVMLHYTAGNRQFYPEPERSTGTFGWKKVCIVKNIPADTSAMELTLGIQGASGEFWVSAIRIWRCVESDDDNVASAPPNPEAQKIPRGDFKGAKYRGFMSGDDLSPAAFQQLADWHVNLLRYQMHPEKRDVSTPEKYLASIDVEIQRIDELLKLARRHHIKLILDLHIGPGTQVTRVSSNILGAGTSTDTLEAAWKKLATRYKGNTDIYGYDLLNEPLNQGTKLSSDKSSWQYIAQRLTDAIRAIDPDTPIIIEPGASIDNFSGMTPIKGKNIIYSPHYYQPFSYTHQGVFEDGGIKWSYPGVIDGTYWDKEQLRVSMKSAIEFSRKYQVPIFVGEFSVINWAKGGDRYIADLISLFEEYGWDWTYHAFREWAAWSVEYEGIAPHQFKGSADNPRKRVLLEALKKNK